MEVVNCNGALYVMTHSRWIEMLRDYADGKSVQCADYGRKVEPFDFSTISREETKKVLARIGDITRVGFA